MDCNNLFYKRIMVCFNPSSANPPPNLIPYAPIEVLVQGDISQLDVYINKGNIPDAELIKLPKGPITTNGIGFIDVSNALYNDGTEVDYEPTLDFLLIKRKTSPVPSVTFKDGAKLSSIDIQKAIRQSLMLAEESWAEGTFAGYPWYEVLFDHAVFSKDIVHPNNAFDDLDPSGPTAGRSGLWFDPAEGSMNVFTGDQWVRIGRDRSYGSVSRLRDLYDVDLTDPVHPGDFLTYNAITQTWINVQGGGAGGGTNLNELFRHSVITKDLTSPASQDEVNSLSPLEGKSGVWFDPAEGSFNVYAGTEWVRILGMFRSSEVKRLEDLENILLSSLQNGDTLVYNEVADKWVNMVPQGGGGPGFHNLSDHLDTAISFPQTGHVLTYLDGLWRNLPNSGSGSAQVLDDLLDVDTTTAISGDVLIRGFSSWINLQATNVNTNNTLVKRDSNGVFQGTLDGDAKGLTNTLVITKGGTNATTKEEALLNLLPSVTNNDGKFLKVAGSAIAWGTPPSSGPGGPAVAGFFNLHPTDGIRIDGGEAAVEISVAPSGETITTYSLSLNDVRMNSLRILADGSGLSDDNVVHIKAFNELGSGITIQSKGSIKSADGTVNILTWAGGGIFADQLVTAPALGIGGAPSGSAKLIVNDINQATIFSIKTPLVINASLHNIIKTRADIILQNYLDEDHNIVYTPKFIGDLIGTATNALTADFASVAREAQRLSQVVPISMGGTSATTAKDAMHNLLEVGASTINKILSNNGVIVGWIESPNTDIPDWSIRGLKHWIAPSILEIDRYPLFVTIGVDLNGTITSIVPFTPPNLPLPSPPFYFYFRVMKDPTGGDTGPTNSVLSVGTLDGHGIITSFAIDNGGSGYNAGTRSIEVIYEKHGIVQAMDYLPDHTGVEDINDVRRLSESHGFRKKPAPEHKYDITNKEYVDSFYRVGAEFAFYKRWAGPPIGVDITTAIETPNSIAVSYDGGNPLIQVNVADLTIQNIETVPLQLDYLYIGGDEVTVTIKIKKINDPENDPENARRYICSPFVLFRDANTAASVYNDSQRLTVPAIIDDSEWHDLIIFTTNNWSPPADFHCTCTRYK